MSELDENSIAWIIFNKVDKYLLQDWDGALSLFEKAKNLER